MWSLERTHGFVYFIDKDNAGIAPYGPNPHLITRQKIVSPSYWNPTEYDDLRWQDLRVSYTPVGAFTNGRNASEASVPLATASPAHNSPNSGNLFMEVNGSAVLYRYPNKILPHDKLEVRDTPIYLQILSGRSKLYDDGVDATTANPNYGNEWAFVLYDDGRISRNFYVHHSQLKPSTSYATRNLDFSDDNYKFSIDNVTAPTQWHGWTGRVLVHNLPIFKHPYNLINTGNNANIIARLPRNFGTLNDRTVPTAFNQGLKLNRRITVRGTNAYFYEIRYNVENNIIVPSMVGEFVGYVDATYVMDAFAGPDREKFTANARIVISSEMTTAGGLQVYSDDKETKYVGEFLQNKDGVQIIGKFDKNAKYTQIFYFAFDRAHIGWVETKYVVPNGITTLQIIAIVAGGTAVCVAIFIIIRHIKLRRGRFQTPEIVS